MPRSWTFCACLPTERGMTMEAKNSISFPVLSNQQIWKLKQVTLLALAQVSKKLTYVRLKKLLDFSSVKDLENFFDLCNTSGVIRGNLYKDEEFFEVIYAADGLQTTRGKVLVQVPFDSFLEKGKADLKEWSCHGTMLWQNGIVKQVWMPPANCCKSELQPKANSLFLSLTQHMTDAHAAGKSFVGQIYAGMFATAGEQLFLRPEAAAQKPLTPDNFAKDRKAVASIMRKNAGLAILHRDQDGNIKQVLYPLYMENLLNHLEGEPEAVIHSCSD